MCLFVKCFVFLTVAITCYIAECRRVKRVIGGAEVSCGTQIRVASLRNPTTCEHLCGATLLSQHFAVTAAHCVDPSQSYLLQLNNYCCSGVPPQIMVREVIKHPFYDKISRSHDIALLRIQIDLQDITWLSDTLLPDSSFGLSGDCSVYGYGYQDIYKQEISEKLLTATLRLISLDECIRLLGPYVAPKHDSGMLCAIGDGTDTCQGDSGGPLICSGKLQGICSYGMSCGLANVPGVYTSIAPQLKWLRRIMDKYNRNRSMTFQSRDD